jgi:hypothetical protein
MYLRSLIGKDDADAVMLMSKRNKKNCLIRNLKK